MAFKHSFTFQDAVIKLSQQEYNLLITDAFVGELSGVELIKICSEYRPNTKVLIVTDDTESSLIQEELSKINFLSKLSKPLDARQIYKLFSDEFNVDPSEFLSSDAREAIYHEKKLNEPTSPSLVNPSTEIEIDSDRSEIRLPADQEVTQDLDKSSSNKNDLNQNFDEDNGSDTTESETTTQDDGKATDQLTLDEVSSAEVVQDDYQDNDESSEVTEDLWSFPRRCLMIKLEIILLLTMRLISLIFSLNPMMG